MHVVQRPIRQRVRKRMYLPSERMVVNGVGLGELDGMFNIGKMFSRLTHFTPSSFKISNIAGAIGSAVAFTSTFGASSLLPKVTGAHSALMKDVGYATVAAAAVVGGGLAIGAIGGAGAAAGGAAGGAATTVETGGMMAAGTGVLAPVAQASYFTMPAFETAGSAMTAGTGVLAPAAEAGGGFFSTVGSALSTVGSGLMTAMKALPLIGQVLGGGGAQPIQQAQDQTQYGPAQPTADQIAAQAAMYQPGGYAPSIPGVAAQYAGPVAPSMDTSYGDLRTPYTAVTEDGQQVQVDPATGQVIQEGILTGMSTEMMVGIGAVTLLAGWYFMSDNKSTN